MNGRFSNTSPDIDAGIDSAAFVFTNTNYSYYIEDNPAPSSFGTYEIITGGMSDTIVFYEDSLGVCSDNGTGTTVKMEIDKTVTPYYSIMLGETAHSMDNCQTHSLRMSGEFIATSGVIYNWSASVNDTKGNDIGLLAYNYGNNLMIRSRYSEKISFTVTNISGQKVLKTQEAFLTQGQNSIFNLSGLTSGIYFVLIQSEHGIKAIKVAL